MQPEGWPVSVGNAVRKWLEESMLVVNEWKGWTKETLAARACRKAHKLSFNILLSVDAWMMMNIYDS